MIKDDWIVRLEAERILKEKIGLKEDEYYIENGQLVFTEKYHLNKNKCCENNCKHCPYKDLSEGDEYRERNFDNYDD